MVVWLLLGAYVLAAFSTLALADRNQAAARAASRAYKANGINGWPLGCFAIVASWAVAIMWTVYGVQQHDWRFVAIAWLPIAAGLGCKMLTAQIKPSRES